MLNLLYCPTCRADFITRGEAKPPYSAKHVNDDQGLRHLHPVSGEVLTGLIVEEEAV